jgi:D-3-phosphoglycerate dehydrogenase
MERQPSLIMVQFLQWVADRPRSREDVMEAWRSSCPRFPVWEDARAEGLIRQCGGERGEHRVELTERGRAVLRRADGAAPPARSRASADRSGRSAW